jgi:hypothetical protein
MIFTAIMCTAVNKCTDIKKSEFPKRIKLETGSKWKVGYGSAST